MTIRRKLLFRIRRHSGDYAGAVLWSICSRWCGSTGRAPSAAAATLRRCWKIIENVRFSDDGKPPLPSKNYLLSGDLRDEEKTNKGISNLLRASERCRGGKGTIRIFGPPSEQVGGQRTQLGREFRQTDDREAPSGWMPAMRPVSDLQIYYLQHDPASWTTKSASVPQRCEHGYPQERSRTLTLPRRRQPRGSTIITTAGTLVAILPRRLHRFLSPAKKRFANQSIN